MHGVACTISWACSCAYSCIPRHIYLSRTSRGINCDHSKVDDRRHAQPPRLVCVPTKHASWIKWWFVLEPWKCVVEFSKHAIVKFRREKEWWRKAKKNWAVVSPLNDRAARGELRGDALTIGTRGTYRAIFEEIKRILEPQLAVQGKWLSDRRWIFYKSRKEVWSN